MRTNKEYPTISSLQEELLIGCVLGDGSLQKQPTSKYPEFTCNHGLKQYEYALWKSEILNWEGLYFKSFKRKTANKITGKFYEYCYLRSKVNKNLQPLYELFYTNKVKVITEELMQKYTPFSMAVHYMDDGYLQSGSYSFATCGFDNKSIEVFRKYLFLNFNIETTVQKQNRVRIRNCSKNLFTNLIKETVLQIPCMRYKLLNVS